MAMNLGGKGVQSEINVTPMIDVVLVLLIIFMVVTPTLEAQFNLALPEIEAAPEPEEVPEEQPLLIELGSSGEIFLNGEEVPGENELEIRLRAALEKREMKVAFFDAADDANYGLAVRVMDRCRGAGAEHIGVIDPEAGGDLPKAPVP